VKRTAEVHPLIWDLEYGAPVGELPETRRELRMAPDGTLEVFVGYMVEPGITLGAPMRNVAQPREHHHPPIILDATWAERHDASPRSPRTHSYTFLTRRQQ